MTMRRALALGLLGAASAQQAGKSKEVQPQMTIQHCKKTGGCKDEQLGITVDGSWRWTHGVGGYTNCLQGNTWEPTFCPNPDTCAQNCVVEGAEKYDHDYGIAPVKGVNGSMELKYVAPGGAVASRVYLVEGELYKVFKLKNREFSMDVDVSTVPCGINAALYFIEMQANGGLNVGHNTAGAKFGAGYCDAQCPRGVKFVNGQANSVNWGMVPAKSPSGAYKADGPVGQYGACCAEMDVFEANREAAAFTAHPCHSKVKGLFKCNGTAECGDKGNATLPGLCDKEGCGFNSWRMGDQKFYGHGADFKINTAKPMTVVTQFLTADGTDDGELTEVRRIWLQDGKVIANSEASALGKQAGNSLTKSVCTAEMETFAEPKGKKADKAKGGKAKEKETTGKGKGRSKDEGEEEEKKEHKKGGKGKEKSEDKKEAKASVGNIFDEYGGLKSMGEALDRGMVLSMSIWHDSLGRMLWLDGEKGRPDDDSSLPGVSRGPCAFESGNPKDLKAKHKDASVKFMNIKYGEINSTFAAGSGGKGKPEEKVEVLDDGMAFPLQGLSDHSGAFSSLAMLSFVVGAATLLPLGRRAIRRWFQGTARADCGGPCE